MDVERKMARVLEATTGLTVLAMGKYGAHELNYSSDIDLVVFYDAEKFPFRQARRSARRGGGSGARPGQADRRDHRAMAMSSASICG